MGGSPNDIRISDMRPTLVEPPMYKPKVVLLGKDKKGRVLNVSSYTQTTRYTKRLTLTHDCTHNVPQ